MPSTSNNTQSGLSGFSGFSGSSGSSSVFSGHSEPSPTSPRRGAVSVQNPSEYKKLENRMNNKDKLMEYKYRSASSTW